ncbi:MAG: deoxyribonuclease V [Deltaproteobacteria bacterium]|nr:deoxyribonuclease V [Deltaproteobacteria bacterium]
MRSHSWELSPKQAVELQKELAPQVVIRDDFGEIRCVAGADMAISRDKKYGYAGVLLFQFPSLVEIDRVHAKVPLKFPYVPGLLSFREIPVLLEAFKKLKGRPDLVFVDGQGIAHPRRLGIASHLGICLDLPTVGCGKSRLCGEYREPGPKRGDFSDLSDKGEVIGAVLRTKEGVSPIFLSTGHRVSLRSALRLTLACHQGRRIPKPTREADRYVAKVKLEDIL